MLFHQFLKWLTTDLGSSVATIAIIALTFVAGWWLDRHRRRAKPEAPKKTREVELWKVETFVLEAVYLALVKTHDARRLLQVDLNTDLAASDWHGRSRQMSILGYVVRGDSVDSFEARGTCSWVNGETPTFDAVMSVNRGYVFRFKATVGPDHRILVEDNMNVSRADAANQR